MCFFDFGQDELFSVTSETQIKIYFLVAKRLDVSRLRLTLTVVMESIAWYGVH